MDSIAMALGYAVIFAGVLYAANKLPDYWRSSPRLRFALATARDVYLLLFCLLVLVAGGVAAYRALAE